MRFYAFFALALCGLLHFLPARAIGQSPERVGQRHGSARSAAERLRWEWSQGQAVGSGPARLSFAPMRLADINSIVPMGLMVGAHVTPSDHVYFEPKDRNAGRFRYDVIAPADGFIVSIQHRNRLDGSTEQARSYDDYRVVLEHSGTFYCYFDLITRLESFVINGMGGTRQGGPPVRTRIPVKAGQVIGKVGGRTLDFGVVNLQGKLPGLLVPEHYDREPWKIHTVDPFDYFDEPLRGQLLALNLRKDKPLGGKIDFDVDGRLVGNWFLEGTNGYGGAGDPRGYWMGHLALVYHHLDPKLLIASMGDYEGRPRQFAVKGNVPDWRKVGPGDGLLRYELMPLMRPSSADPLAGSNGAVQGVLLVELLDKRKLRLELFPGKSANEVSGFTDRARTYER